MAWLTLLSTFDWAIALFLAGLITFIVAPLRWHFLAAALFVIGMGIGLLPSSLPVSLVLFVFAFFLLYKQYQLGLGKGRNSTN